jgi:hypothetical protein
MISRVELEICFQKFEELSPKMTGEDLVPTTDNSLRNSMKLHHIIPEKLSHRGSREEVLQRKNGCIW